MEPVILGVPKNCPSCGQRLDARGFSVRAEGCSTCKPPELLPITRVAAVTKRQLPILSNSSITTFRRCPREYQFRYIKMRKPRSKGAALRFGSLFHRGLNAWWLAGSVPPSARLFVAIDALNRERTEDTDEFEMMKAVALLVGYTARWGEEKIETLHVERVFRYQLAEPGELIGDPPVPLPYDLGGALDVIGRDEDGDLIVEHKTSSEDISEGSDYWRHVEALDTQVTTYLEAARAMGFNPRKCLYDVVRKPTLDPYTATPEDQRKYTKPTKAEPVPRLYANQRDRDETPAEYGERLTADITANPSKYFARLPIVRLEHDNEAHARDVEATAHAIMFAEHSGRWPRHPNACERFHRLCEYHPVCSGQATIDDESRYMTKEKNHEELGL